MNKRLMQLLMVLAYDSDTFETTGKRFLTAGQRILINRERSNLMNDILDTDQSPIVNEKVDFVIEKIKQNKLTAAYAAHARVNLL